MGNSGFFLVYRRLFDHEIGQDPLVVALWIRLLSDASYEDKTVYWNGKAIDIKRGQVITSILKLSKWLGVSRRTTDRYIDALQNVKQININKTNKYTVITVRNYDKYQVGAQQTHNKLATNSQQTRTTKEYKEIKEYKEAAIGVIEKLQNEFPDIDVKKKYEELAKREKQKGTKVNDWYRYLKKILESESKNEITEDAMFSRLLTVNHATIGHEWELKSSLIDKLNNKYPLPGLQRIFHSP